ncbi:HAMP domain-containing sensor histidine kinase [Actinoplanes sp. NPDC051411]|uniref:sensor histidine kinase n=1 Tax=Actinoplanes sp. NPDC051411 TaxID=3155522 RepID=UPI003414003A
MTVTERIRHVVANQQPKLRRVPLRTKLVAAVLALVFAALSLISAASTYALHSFLIGRMDNQLHAYAQQAAGWTGSQLQFSVLATVLPPDYLVSVRSVSGVGWTAFSAMFTDQDLPQLDKGVDEINEHLDTPYTVRSQDGKYMWRVLVERLSNGSILRVGQRMTGVEDATTRLVWVDVLVGAGVLIALASLGAAVVRQSLVPLLAIERTAARIAAGDLSQRVLDPENDPTGPPMTELGRLSRALNAMLVQIEAAFIARAQSEAAAMEAAEAARLSESRAVQSEAKMRQFVADASHELRTPLTTIRGFAELYRQGAVQNPDDVAKLVRRIEDEAARMGLLVEDLLLLARLDRERPLNLAPVELPVLAIDAVQAAEATAPDRTIRLEIADEPERLVAYGDDGRLRQVISNLMTNALVHTPPEASVTLRLYAEPGDRAVVEISDTGPGLTDVQRARVFERFYRADEARTRHTEREATGTGLGLAIVAAIVAAHEGSVEVLSEPGHGATFRVSLPTLNPDKGFTENVQG